MEFPSTEERADPIGSPQAEALERRRRTFLRVGVFLVPALAIFTLFGLLAFRAGPRDVGSPAPSFSLERLDGRGRISSSDFRGKPYVLNFWASWCIPCREEAPMLAEVVGSGDSSPAFIGVNILDGRSDARRFVREFRIRYPNAWDPRASFRDFRVAGIPETVFVGSDGRIVGRWIGAIDEANLRRLLADLRTLRSGELLRITGRGPQVGVG